MWVKENKEGDKGKGERTRGIDIYITIPSLISTGFYTSSVYLQDRCMSWSRLLRATATSLRHVTRVK